MSPTSISGGGKLLTGGELISPASLKGQEEVLPTAKLEQWPYNRLHALRFQFHEIAGTGRKASGFELGADGRCYPCAGAEVHLPGSVEVKDDKFSLLGVDNLLKKVYYISCVQQWGYSSVG